MIWHNIGNILKLSWVLGFSIIFIFAFLTRLKFHATSNGDKGTVSKLIFYGLCSSMFISGGIVGAFIGVLITNTRFYVLSCVPITIGIVFGIMQQMTQYKLICKLQRSGDE